MDAQWQAWVSTCLAFMYLYISLMLLLFGVGHLGMMLLDVTSKDVATGELRDMRDLPCFPGARNPRRLLAHAWAAWCAPVKRRRPPVAATAHPDTTLLIPRGSGVSD